MENKTIDLKNEENVIKDLAAQHGVDFNEFSLFIFNARKYEILGIINRCNDDKHALSLLKELPIIQDETFMRLMHLVKEDIYRNKYCEQNKFCVDNKRGDLTKEDCEKRINMALISKMEELIALGERESHKKVELEKTTKVHSLHNFDPAYF